ncbi:MAG: histidine kinase [Gemmatimonadaceae bacterium]|jgi:signal transduction histidine kinase|nr:histidine kinase [Gemmatimonadaceae bacterium]
MTPWLRGALWYLVAWTPLILLYAVMIGWSAPLPVAQAVDAAVRTVVWAAFLGVGVLWLARRWSWPTKPTPRFFAVHFGMALLFAAVWDLFILYDIAGYRGAWREALERASPWIHWQSFEALLIYAAICGFVWTRQAAEQTRQQQALAAQADALRTRAELEALRGRLDPHFLFNTLHSVSVLVHRDPAMASQALERLSDLLRYVLDAKRGGREAVPLADEIAFTEAYLALEAIRFGDRLRVETTIDERALDLSVPSFVLQPLVENAIKHAIAPRATGGTVRVDGRLDADRLVLEVRDDGPGTSAPVAAVGGTGVGLDALRRRLAARYGMAAELTAGALPGGGFGVTVRLPA